MDYMSLLNKFREIAVLEILGILGFDSLDTAMNSRIPIQVLKDPDVISRLNELVPDLKRIYSSDKLTCLHTNNVNKQKFPGVNMLRQILRISGFELQSTPVYQGYDNEGKKMYVRQYYITTRIPTKVMSVPDSMALPEGASLVLVPVPEPVSVPVSELEKKDGE
ncbi:MAG: hypothetical protein ACYCOU_01405 [Sulfobacillus sp.]